MMTLSAIVLTRNEEQNIGDCLGGLRWADEILVLDSGSTDRTREIAERLGARVVRREMDDFASQRNFAMREARGDWILFVDADERVPKPLGDEIRNILKSDPVPAVYRIPRQNYFFGKRLRFADARGDAPARFFPRRDIRWVQPVHEMVASELPVCFLRSALLHYSTRDLAHYRQKIREYVPRELVVMRQKGLTPSVWRVLFAGPAKFFQLYILNLGFLDGVVGFQYAILSSYYSFEKNRRYFSCRS